jgi:glycosyltransferase involved in cell wall biosynthesis
MNGAHKILLVVDQPGWAYDSMAKGIKRLINDRKYEIDILSIKNDLEELQSTYGKYDLIFAMSWTLVMAKKAKRNFMHELLFLDRGKLVAGIHSHRSWDNYQSRPDYCPGPPRMLVNELAKLKRISVISRRLFRTFRDAGLTNITLTESGVDTDLFVPTRPVNVDRQLPLVLGFSGSTEIDKHDDLKGYSQFIAPLNELKNVEIVTLGGKGPERVAPAEMPDLYNKIDLYICASSSEGFSQSVMEASSCGRGVVSTRVGGCEDLIVEGFNGFFVDRTLEDMTRCVLYLEANRDVVKRIGENNRSRVVAEYSWKAKIDEWERFLDSNLPSN